MRGLVPPAAVSTALVGIHGFAMARSSGVQMSGSAEDLVAKLAGLDLGELSFGNIASVVQRTMQRRPCSDPVTRRLEDALIQYSAAGGIR